MSRRGRQNVEEDEGLLALTTPSTRETTPSSVERIYDAMLKAVSSGAHDIRQVYEQYMPLIISELEADSIIYPYLKELFVETYLQLWSQWFPNINPPEISPNESLSSIQAKTFQTLMDNAGKIAMVGLGRASMTLDERAKEIRYLTHQFVFVVAKFVMRVMGRVR